jgi:hypothetical protein
MWEVFDGNSSETNSTSAVTVAPASPPVVTVTPLQETSGAGSVALSAHVSFSQANGDPATSWRVEDVSTDPTGALLINGVAQAENEAFNITTAQFAAMQIAPVAVQHQIWVIGYDGTLNSSPVHFTVAPPVAGAGSPSPSPTPTTPPVVTVTPLQETSGAGAVALSAHAQFSDPDGETVASWRVEDVSSDPNGALLLNGTAQAENTAFTITTAQFAAMQIAPVTVAHEIWVLASDGTSWSKPVHFTVSPPPSSVANANVTAASSLASLVQAAAAFGAPDPGGSPAVATQPPQPDHSANLAPSHG